MSSRRRLRIIDSSSDEEEDEEVVVQPPPQPQEENDYMETETLNIQSVNLNPNSHSVQIDISDEDFIDATEDLSPSSPPPEPQPTVTSSEGSRTSSTSNGGMNMNMNMNMNEVSFSPISRVLEGLGLRLKGEWLDACIRSLQTAFPNDWTSNGFNDTKKAKLCFEKFLESDMNYCGAGLLPENVHQMHLVDLPGPFVLQVDEIVNISLPLRERYKGGNKKEGDKKDGEKKDGEKKDGEKKDGDKKDGDKKEGDTKEGDKKEVIGLKRCLKLSMTDGVQRVFGMEYQPIHTISAFASAGLKVAIANVHVRRGLLVLVPEVIQVLGGSVTELEDARKRLVEEVNKPPRGKRTRSGVVPPLATRATSAAWPANYTYVPQPPVNPVSQRATSMQVDDQGTTPVSANRDTPSHSAIPVQREHAAPHPPRTEVGSSFSTRRENVESFPSMGTTSSATPVYRAHAAHHPQRTEVDYSCSTRRENIEPHASEPATNSAIPVHRDQAAHRPKRTELDSLFSTVRNNIEPPPSMATTESSATKNTSHAVPVIKESVETTPLRVREEATVPCPRASPVVVSDDDDVHMASAEETHSAVGQSTDCPPFTYLSNLFSKWDASINKASHVEGKIKCFVTGVKRFSFKERNTYELQVYIDDGSLISEILIDHNVVQKRIGYSPDEVNAALSSADPLKVKSMKDIMKQFQVFLINFEGIMAVWISEASSLPVAKEMHQGCPLSVALLLLTRLKSSNAHKCPPLDPIYLSP